MTLELSWYIIPAAFALDYFLGDPNFSLHPIRLLGRVVLLTESLFRHLSTPLFFSGLLFAVSLILGTWVVAVVIVLLAAAISPVLAGVVNIIIIYFCISARCLEKEALGIRNCLAKKRLEEAKNNLSMIVGRDVDALDASGISRAAVETVAENLVDGVISPLFFAVIGGAPLALAFKMVNTLDSMVGYKNERYVDFGKAAARIDDVANFIPARISVLIISLAAFILFRTGKPACSTAVRQGRNHSSPNAGYPEAAFAGGLSVCLGGPNFYFGRLVEKPYIGQGMAKVRPLHIEKACRLMMLSAVISMVAAALGTLF